MTLTPTPSITLQFHSSVAPGSEVRAKYSECVREIYSDAYEGLIQLVGGNQTCVLAAR